MSEQPDNGQPNGTACGFTRRGVLAIAIAVACSFWAVGERQMRRDAERRLETVVSTGEAMGYLKRQEGKILWIPGK